MSHWQLRVGYISLKGKIMKHYAIFKYANMDEEIPADLVEIGSSDLRLLQYPNLSLAPFCYLIKVFDCADEVTKQNYKQAQKLNEKVINLALPVYYSKEGMFLYTSSGRLKDNPFKEQYKSLKNKLDDKHIIFKPKYGSFLFAASKTDRLQNPKRCDECEVETR